MEISELNLGPPQLNALGSWLNTKSNTPLEGEQGPVATGDLLRRYLCKVSMVSWSGSNEF